MIVEFYSMRKGCNCAVELTQEQYDSLRKDYDKLSPAMKNQFSDFHNYVQAVCSFNIG